MINFIHFQIYFYARLICAFVGNNILTDKMFELSMIINNMTDLFNRISDFLNF